MTMSDKVFAGAVPDLYDRLMVPTVFEGYARELAGRVVRFEPGDVLEVAAGTGVVTGLLSAELPRDTRIVATDLNQPMLDRAIAKFGNDPRIEWRQADALQLPFAAGSFDVVACQFGAMFFPDKAKAYGEARRVLRDGGHYLFSVWDRLETNEAAAVVAEALGELFPDDPPRFLARTPHGYHDAEAIGTSLAVAGFRAIEMELQRRTSGPLSARDLATAFCQGTPLRNEIEARDPEGPGRATDIVAEALEKRFGGGVIESALSALLFTAMH